MFFKRGRFILTVALCAVLSFNSVLCVNAQSRYRQVIAHRMLPYINELRTQDAWYLDENENIQWKTNVGELQWDKDLERIAKLRAKEIYQYYSHTRPDGQPWNTAYTDNESRFYIKGENIAYGYRTPKQMYIGFAEEDENYAGQVHRRNMIDERFTHIGIACYEKNGVRYWVQELGGIRQ